MAIRHLTDMNTSTTGFFVTGGAVPRDAPSYVMRQADFDLLDGLRQGEFCYVLTSRQMGKSSLMVRTASRLRAEGVTCLILDLTAIGVNVTPDQWYGGLLRHIGRQLGIEDLLDEFWLKESLIGPVQRWMLAIEHLVLPASGGRVVIFIDEIDAVRSLPFSADEFFAAIRECYSRRQQDAEFERLTFCLFGVARPSDLIRDPQTTPFNIGRRIELFDFTPLEAAPLATGFRQTEALNAWLLRRVLFWTGGQPYLTQRLCQAVAEEALSGRGLSVDAICREIFLVRGMRDNDHNLSWVQKQVLEGVEDRVGLLDLYAGIHSRRLTDPKEKPGPLLEALKLTGLVKAREGRLEVRNRIYNRAFDRGWVHAAMPNAELRRQKAAFRHGLARATSIAGIVIAIIGTLALIALRQKRAADHSAATARVEADRANRLLYVADMNLIPGEWENNDVAHVLELLQETRHNKERNFEWGYWWRLCHLDRARLAGHTGSILSVSVSADGRRIVTGSRDSTAKVWDAATGSAILTLKGHSDAVTSVALSADGLRIVTGSGDNTAKIWDAATGQEIDTLKGHTKGILSVAISADGRRIVTGSQDSTAKVWDAATGGATVTLKGHSEAVTSVAISADGRRIVTGSQDSTARIWDAASGHEVLLLQETDGILSVGISADSRRIITASYSNTAQVWDMATGRRVRSLKGHTGLIYSLAISADGRRIVTGSEDNTAKVWDAATGQEIFTLKGHTSLTSIAISADGRRIVTGSDDKTADVWDTETGEEIITLTGHSDSLYCAAASHDRTRIVTGNWDGIAKVWDSTTGQEILTLKGHRTLLPVYGAAFSPDGRRIVTHGGDGTAKVWDATTGRETFTLQEGYAISSDGLWIVTTRPDGTAKVWDATTGREISTLKGHLDTVTALAVSADGRRIVTDIGGHRVKIWDASTGEVMLTLRGHAGPIDCLAFSPDGRRIVGGSEDNTAMVWDASTGEVMLTLRGHAGPIYCLAFSPDGRRIVTGSGDKTAKVWDMTTGRVTLTLKWHSRPVRGLWFSSDGTALISCSEGGIVRRWTFATDAEIAAREASDRAVMHP